MPWAKLDDQFTDHPKILAAGPLAGWLFICGLCYASRYLTDGYIPLVQVRKLADLENAAELAERLVESGLWARMDDGYMIHDYLEYNPSRLQVLAAREANARRQEQWRQSHRQGDGIETATNGPSNAVSHTRPVPGPVPGPVPDPIPEVQQATPAPRKRRAPNPRPPAQPDPAGVTAYFQVCGRKPRKETYPLFAERIPDDEEHLATLQRAISLWVADKHDPANINGILDWYDALVAGRNPAAYKPRNDGRDPQREPKGWAGLRDLRAMEVRREPGGNRATVVDADSSLPECEHAGTDS